MKSGRWTRSEKKLVPCKGGHSGGLTKGGQYFIVLLMVSAFFLFLNLCCCFSVRNNIEAKIRTCFTFLLDVALCGALGLAAAIGVNEVELDSDDDAPNHETCFFLIFDGHGDA